MIRRIRQKVVDMAISVEPQDQPEAAVLMAITDESTPHLVLTRRAEHLTSHAGEVAFPGGKKDLEDLSLQHTALRETHEEIGLRSEAIDIIGALSPANSKFGLRVTPFVGVVDPRAKLVANKDELDEIFHVPLEFFINNQPNDVYQFPYKGEVYVASCYNYQGHIIWGLTAYFIADFMNAVFDTQITIELRGRK